jgi:hypothetical protein
LTRNLTVADGARIANETSGSGAPGDIRITADQVQISNGGIISSRSSGTGVGGQIEIAANSVSLINGGAVDVSSTGAGNAGNIFMTGASLFSDHGTATAQSLNSLGGNMQLSFSRIIHLLKSSLTTDGGIGDGNLTLNAPQIILNASSVGTNAAGGLGAKLSISSQLFLPSSDSIVFSNGGLDISGQVVDIDRALAPLPDSPLEATLFLRQSCAARYSSGQASSLAALGRGGLPFEPGNFMPSPIYPNNRESEKVVSEPDGRIGLAGMSIITPTKYPANLACGS